MTTPEAESLATEPYNNPKPLENGLFRVTDVASKSPATNENGILSTLSIYWPTLASAAKCPRKYIVWPSKDPISKLEDKVKKGGGQAIA